MTASRQVRVLFDMYELSRSSGKSIGIYVYAVGLLNALKDRVPEGMQLVVACHADNLADLQAAAGPRVELVPLLDRHPGLLRRQWWWRVGAHIAARRLGCQAYFSPKGFMPGWWGRSWGLRTCVVLHDLIPLWYGRHYPGQFGWLEERLVNQGLLRTCRHADQVIAISQATADDIGQQARRTAPIAVVHNGLEPPPLSEPAAPSGRESFILGMTSDLPHKNAAVLLEGYRLYRQSTVSPLPLVVCGLQGSAPEGVTYVKGLSRAQLFGYYRDAAVFVFLSRTEGFGYPPLEAMQQGTGVICSDIQVLRETTRGNAMFVDPQDAQALKTALLQYLSPDFEGSRMAMREQAPKVVARYGWERAAEDVMLVLQQCVGG